MTKRIFQIVFLIPLLFGFINKSFGQNNYPITLQVQLAPPYSAYISDYKYKPIISFTNHSQIARDVYIRGRLDNDRGQYIQTAPNVFSNIPIHVPGLQTVVVQGNQLDENYLNLNNLQTNLDDKSYSNLFQFGMIPEGFYTFCIYAYTRDANGNYFPVSDPQGPGGCFAYNVGYVSPPQILNPLPGDKILPTPNQNMNISWTRPVGNMQGASLVYDLYLVKVLPDENPYVSLNNAVQYGAGIFLKQSNIPINNFQFTNLTTFQLDEGSQYALMVQARDLTGKTAFENNGRSQIRIFQYGETQKAVAVSGKLPIVEQGNCSCAVDVASLDQINNNAALKAGGSFSMATLPIKIGSLNNNGGTVSGDGTIMMNNVPVQVTFTEVVVNKSGIAIAGRAVAKKANGFDFLTNGGSPSVSTANYKSFIDRIRNYNLDAIKNGAGFMLPFGLHAAGTPDGVNAAVVSLNITPSQATYNAVAAVQLADANQVLSMTAKDVCFSNATCMCGNALFVLNKDFNVPGLNLNFKSYQSKTKPGTYVLYSKNKLKKFHIHAEYNFPASQITQANGSPEKAILDADIKSWSSWTASVAMDPFIVPSLKNVVFTLNGNAYYDHSTLKNPTGMPSSFNDAALAGKNPVIGNALWTGFFIPKVTVALPSIVKNTRRPDNKLEISAANLILDKAGLTGVVAAQNIVNIGDGSVGGWYCSVDRINIKLLNSSFKEGGLYGQIILPFSDKNKVQSRIAYSSTLSSSANGGDVKYQFIAKQKNDIDFSAWWAHIDLNNIAIEVTNNTETGNTAASAALSGKLNIEGNIEGYKIGLDLIKVENLVVRSEEPYVRVGNISTGFSFSSPQHSIAGFPVSITDVRPTMVGNNVGLQFDLGLTLSDINSKLLPDATTTLVLSANVLGGDRPIWKRTDFNINKVKVSGNLAGIVQIDKGEIDFMRDDPAYGDGIRGILHASFAGLPGASVDCHAMFGNKSGNNYWYFDAYGTLPEPVPIGPGISLQGLGGGAYYNLAPTVLKSMKPEDYFANRSKYRLDKYQPRPGSFGMKLMVGISSSDGTLFTGIGTLGATFNVAGGFSLQSLNGNAYIQLFKISGSDVLEADDNAPVKADVDWLIGVSDKVFSINAAVDINYLGWFKGGGNFALLADAKNQNYYIKIGNPRPLPGPNDYGRRIHLSMQDPLHILDLKLKAYFMAGNKINSSLPEPDPGIVNVGELPGYQKLHMSSKGGVVMGASAKFSYDLRFLVFFFEAKAGLGFDVALQSAVTCADGEKAGGFNGWYALGQAYAGLEGAFGLYVDMFFCHDCKLTALRLRADILVQAGLPNPMWLKGYTNTHYEVLNGLIEGNIGFKVAIGKACVVQKSAFTLPLIQEVKPNNGKTEVPLNAYPEFVFNYPIEKPFELIDPNFHRPWRFKIEIDDLTITNTDDNTVYADYRDKDSHPAFDDNHHDLTLLTIDALKGQTNYRTHIKVKAMQSKIAIGPNFVAHYTDSWTPAIDKNGQPVIGDSTSTFKTGACKPDQIISDSRNRLGAYPFPNQRYFLQGESKRGAIILDKAYGCLRNVKEKYKLFARFTPVKGGKELPGYESPITEGAGQYLYFDIPKLPNETIIRVEIIKRTQFSKLDDYIVYNISPALASRLNRAIHTEGSNTMKVGSQYYQAFDNKKNSAYINKSFNTSNHKATLGNKNLDVVLYSYHFKTSRYNTLADKMAGARFDKVLYHFFGAGSQLKVAERFDTYDVKGFTSDNYINKEIMFYTMPLVVLKENNDLNKWMKEQAVPLVYKKFDDANIDLDKARIEKGLSPRELQLEGIGCTVSFGRYCVPQRPVFIEDVDQPLTAKEIKAAEPTYINGINVSGFKVVKRSQMVNTATKFNQVNN